MNKTDTAMNHRFYKFFGRGFAAIGLLAVTAACSSDSDDISGPNGGEPEQTYTYRLSSKVSAPSASLAEATRALTYKEDIVETTIEASWGEVEKVKIRNPWFDSQWDKGDNLLVYDTTTTGAVAAETAGKTSDFTGRLQASTPIRTGDKLIFAYPGNLPRTGNTVTVDLSQQDGSLETIGKKMDLQWGTADVTDVTSEQVTAKADLKHQMAFLGLFYRTVDTDPKNASYIRWTYTGLGEDEYNVTVKKIRIKGVNLKPEFDLLTGRFTSSCSDPDGVLTIAAVKKAYGMPDEQGNGYCLYVALAPGTYDELTIELDADGVTEGYPTTFTLKDVTLEAGKIKHKILNGGVYFE